MVGDEPDRHRDDVSNAPPGELLEVLAELRPGPWLRRAALWLEGALVA